MINEQVGVVIYTVNREENYLEKTFNHLIKAGASKFIICQGSSSYNEQNNLSFLDKLKGIDGVTHYPNWHESNSVIRYNAQKNYINALTVPTSKVNEVGKKYRLILEDDVQASVNTKLALEVYLNKVKAVEGDKPFILTLYTPYINNVPKMEVYKMDVNAFYGLQACLFSESICEDFAKYIEDNLCKEPHDFLIKDFCKINNIPLYAVSHSLFQHIGVKTTGLGHHHTASNFLDDHSGVLNEYMGGKAESKENTSDIKGIRNLTSKKVNPKKRILVSAEYLIQTGFSTVAENIIEFLKPHYNIVVVDFYKDSSYLSFNGGVTVIGKKNNEDTFGAERIALNMGNFDAIFIINDAWNIDSILNTLKLSGNKIPQIITYFPIDASLHYATWYKHFDVVGFPVTYTNYAKEVVREASLGFANKEHGESLLSKISIIPHGINKNHFFRISDKKKVRRELFKTDKFDNSYIVLNANRNQPRKKLDITMRAFAQFVHGDHENNKDAYLYMHTAIQGSNINVYELAKKLKIENNLILSTTLENESKKPNATEQEMNLIYNACDVGINTSIGEGWGLCSVEQASLGIPQIVPYHSACKEIFSIDECEYIQCVEDIMQDGIMTMASLPNVDSATFAIARFANKENREAKAKLTYDKFSSSDLEWEGKISEAWLKIFQLATS